MPAKTDLQERTELAIRLEHLAVVVEKLNEGMEGTNRTKGMKEKITLAEYNIEANKLAFKEMQDGIGKLEERIGKSLAEATMNIRSYIDSKFADLKRENETLKLENSAQQSFLDKVKPWLSGLQWAITLIAGIVVTMIVTGKLHLGFTP